MPPSTARHPDYEVVGNYELIRPLGEGGTARVFLARHRESGAEVVLKRMHAERARDPAFRRIFKSELRALMGFRHPGAVALLDASRDDEAQPFVVMEYVHGLTLHEVLECDGRLTPEQMGAILGPVCVVLAAAHAQDLIHRDLTPANLMIIGAGTPRQTVKVMDFGLARLGSGFYIAMEQLTGDGSGIGAGTPDYICPEQIRGEPVDGRGDLYSLGIVLFRALTGHLPFQGAVTVRDILLAHREHTPPRFADLGVTDVPEAIEALVQRCLAKAAAERPPSARALAECYGAALGQPIADTDALDSAESSAGGRGPGGTGLRRRHGPRSLRCMDARAGRRGQAARLHPGRRRHGDRESAGAYPRSPARPDRTGRGADQGHLGLAAQQHGVVARRDHRAAYPQAARGHAARSISPSSVPRPAARRTRSAMRPWIMGERFATSCGRI